MVYPATEVGTALLYYVRYGRPALNVRRLLGHRNLESTCVYLRLAVDDLRDVALSLPVVVDCSAPEVSPCSI